MAVSELFSDYMNQDLKEKVFAICASRISVPQQLFRHHGNLAHGFIEHETVVILGEVPVKCGIVPG